MLIRMFIAALVFLGLALLGGLFLLAVFFEVIKGTEITEEELFGPDEKSENDEVEENAEL